MGASYATLSKLFSNEAVAISPDSAVVAPRSARQPQQVNESNDAALGIDSLPDEMIVEVFSHLSQNQLGQIASVCRRWSVLTKSPVLWKKVDVEIFYSSDKFLIDVIKPFIDGLPSCVTFIRLDFADRRYLGYLDFEKLCMKLHHSCPTVEVLILIRCSISFSLSEVINFCTHFLSGLKKLVFRYSQLSGHCGTVELKDNSNIEVLDLNCSFFAHANKMQFPKLLSLRELCLAETEASDPSFAGDASFLNQLHVLDLRNTLVDASTFRAIERRGQNLEELYLCGLCVRDHHLNFNNPHLQTICLRDTYVTGDGLVPISGHCLCR